MVSAPFLGFLLSSMAAHVQKGIQDLENEITCAICLTHYTEPKVLPCCHYYCKKCILSLAKKKATFSCPECRADTTLPQDGVDSLQAAFFINRMQEVHSKLELAQGKVEAKCEICSVDKVVAFCRQCAQFVCAECVKSHVRMKKAFPGHQVVTLEDLRKKGAKEVVVLEPAVQMCQLHEQPMNIYCFDCKSLICLYCSIKTHSNHNHESVKVAVSDTKKKLLERLNSLSDTKTTLSQSVSDVQSVKKEVSTQGQSDTRKIEESFAELLKIVKDRKKALLTESKEGMDKKLKLLSVQEKTLTTKCAVIQGVIDFTKQFVEHSSNDEVMCKQAEIHSRIDKELQVGADLEPVEEVDTEVQVNCAEKLRQLCQNQAKLTRLILTLQCTEIKGPPAVGMINQEVEYEVSIKLSNGQPASERRLRQVQGTVTDHYGRATNCTTTKTQAGVCHFQFTPYAGGQHSLTLTANGQDLTGGALFYVDVYEEEQW